MVWTLAVVSITAWQWDAVVFCAAAALVGLVWLGYPAGVFVWARRRRPGAAALPTTAPVWPSASLIVAAHNEAQVIGERIANALALDYPREKLEIIVVEDGSSDGTAERARACGGDRVQVLGAPLRTGKPAALNRAAATATGEILVFSDANNLYEPDCLRHLLAPFADPNVGATAGCKAVAAHAGVGGGESVYWRFERWLMRQESRRGSVVNAPGEILAIRRSCFQPLPTQSLVNDDLGLIWTVLAQGYRVAFAAEARSLELAAATPQDEWRRRTRIASARWRMLRSARPLLARMPLEARVKIAFHQVLRPVSPMAMLLALLAGLPLLAPAARAALPLWVQAAAWMQAAVYGAAALGFLLERQGWRCRPLQAAFFFVASQGGNLFGAWQGWRKSEPAAWRRVHRAGEGFAAAKGGASTRSPTHDVDVNQRTVVSGLAWAGSSFVLGKLVVFASVMVLARLLAPRDFGEIAVVLTCIMFLEIVGRLGLYSALIYEPDDITTAAAPVFWLTLATSVAAAAAAWFAAPLVAGYFHEPLIRPMLRVLAPSLVLTALGGTHDALLRRALAFRQKLMPDMAMATAKGLASVVLALMHFGAWSLIWGQWVGLIANAVTLWIVVPWRPGRRWTPALAGKLLAYGKHICLMETSGTILANLDTITIGRMLGDTPLGFYNLAMRIPEVLLVSVLNIITGVIFPALSRLQQDRRALQHALLETIRYSVLLGLPLAVGMALLARELVLAVYGRHWGPSVPVLRVLALYVALRCVTHHFGDAYKAIGRPDILSKLTLAWWALLPPLLIVGARRDGIIGVAWGEAAARALIGAVHFWLLFAVVGIAPRALWQSLRPALEASAFMAGMVWLARPSVAFVAPAPALSLLVAVGLASYGLLLWVRHRGLLETARAALIEVMHKGQRLQTASTAPE
ncbi:MAG TPA: oligosaccharide flippase family protein [Terriglobales bacterium]|nr:oligosaccharide flippase family protein [Terriglobales bacterium]